MCKIILKYGDITADEIEDHRESCEKGAGIIWWNAEGQKFDSARDMTHRGAYEGYLTQYIHTRPRTSPFSLFHSRLPSAGDETPMNVQPFHSDGLGFCHNGTVDSDGLVWGNLYMGNAMVGGESDSLLLFKVLRKTPLISALVALRGLRQNFILVSKRFRQVYIIGFFDVERSADKTHVLSARNKWGGDRAYIVTNFEGKILHENIQKVRIYTPSYFDKDKETGNGKKSKKNNGCGTDQRPEWWEKV